MARVRDYLDRFRPAGAPGAASGAGVPADRRADLDVELRPVFAALTEVEQECARIREQADRRARARSDEAAERARTIVAGAASDARATRAAAAVSGRRQAAGWIAEIGAAADREAEAVQRRARAVRRDLVTRAVAMLRAEIAGRATDGEAGTTGGTGTTDEAGTTGGTGTADEAGTPPAQPAQAAAR